MASPRPGDDPYGVLGVLPDADLGQIKAAHRRLAKRFHPDRSTGDEERFLAVQDAYQLLSDPKRRGEWDRLHAPGPIRASTATGPRRRPRAGSPSTGQPAPRRSGTARAAQPTPPPGRRSRTWSAEHIPWWNDFRPRRPGEADPRDPAWSEAPADRTETIDLDVFSRSSGAAWSAAARRHFRRGDADLPSRGAWRYRGTQVVTGAEARKVAAEEATRTARPASTDRDPTDDGPPR
jgi:curved DNA-binding protein CbpA